MPKSESASASVQLGPQDAPSGPSEASVPALSGGRTDRGDASTVELDECRQAFERPVREQLGLGRGREITPVILHKLDAFENTWFELTPKIIRNFVPEKVHADAIEHDLFLGLVNRPCGVQVIGSLRTYLSRVEELPRKYKTNPRAKYATEVRARLKSAGLPAEVVQSWLELLRDLEDRPVITRPDDLRR
ncbi:hypothetical protein [Sorangium sp. So ce1335]|uniref:hypothetical protein n=1 Tax=Sorangium sp. So ce1335 TaxID=3133335 RepID=UPI003F5F2A23